MDFKNYSGDIIDVDLKGKRVSGYLSAFDNKDSDGDIIVKGAYSKSIKERKNDIYFLNQHNWAQPHGKFDELKEDSKGLYFVSNPLIDTTYSMDALKLYDAGIVKEHSVGFQTIKDEVTKDARIIKEIKLYEGSTVTLGANSNTPFTGFKSLNKKDVDVELKKFLKAFRNSTFTDETFTLLEIAIKQLMKQSADLAVEEYKSLKADKTHFKPMQSEEEILTNYLKKWN